MSIASKAKHNGTIEAELFRLAMAACCRVAAFAAVLLSLLAGQALADLVSPFGGETAPNFAEIRVLEGRVSIALEIDLHDFPFFVAGDKEDPRSLSERTGKTMTVLADGKEITPITRAIEVRDRKPRISAAKQVTVRGRREPTKKVVFVELDFAFAGHPRTITIAPPMETDGIPAASIGMLVEHRGVPVTDYRYLSVRETLKLDWDDPWFSAFENPNLTRHHKSPLMSFISVEPREIRHEVIFRLRDLEHWIDLDLGETEEISAAEMERVKQQAAIFFSKHNPLKVDGVDVLPADAKVSQLTVGVSGLAILENVEMTNRATALLGIILSYPRDALANQLSMTWDLFPGDLQSVPVTITDPAGGLPGKVTPKDPTTSWKNYLTQWVEPSTKPVAAASEGGLLKMLLASFGAGDRKPDAEQAVRVMTAVLENISAALLETTEARLMAALEPFVSQDNQSAVAAEIERGLAARLPSGVSGRIDLIRDLQVEDISNAGQGTQILASWTTEISGDHWGHPHRRSIRYRGLFEMQQRNGSWYLKDLTILNAQDEQV